MFRYLLKITTISIGLLAQPAGMIAASAQVVEITESPSIFRTFEPIRSLNLDGFKDARIKGLNPNLQRQWVSKLAPVVTLSLSDKGTYDACLRNSTSSYSLNLFCTNQKQVSADQELARKVFERSDAVEQIARITATSTDRSAITELANKVLYPAPDRAKNIIQISTLRQLCDENAGGTTRDDASKTLRSLFIRTLSSKNVAKFQADDVAQETILKVLLKCKDILSKPNPPAYVGAMLRNNSQNRFRDKPTASFEDAKIQEEVAAVASSVDTASDYETNDMVQRLEKTLTVREWQVFTALIQEQETCDIAAGFDISKDRVRDIRAQIRKKFISLH